MAGKPKILIAESANFSPRALSVLVGIGQVLMADLDRHELKFALKDADILWVRLRHQLDEDLMSCAPRLKVIVSPTTGLNHIDLEAAARRNITVLCLRGETEFLRDIRATAEHTLALMLALMRRLPAATRHVQSGGWNRDLFRGNELCGKTVGVVGYGRLGKLVSRYVQAFEARVIVTDPYVNEPALEPGLKLTPLLRLLREADIVTLHVNLNAETKGFFGQEQFGAMKRGAWFVNTARGELIDEAALLKALKSRQLAGAALDVLNNEPCPNLREHPLVVYSRRHPNLLITPHLGGCTSESMQKTELFMAEKLGELLASKPIFSEVAAREAISSGVAAARG